MSVPAIGEVGFIGPCPTDLHIYNSLLHIFSRDYMVNVTIAVPEDLKQLLDKHPEINWSEVARQAWWQKARELELLNQLTQSSRVSDKDVLDLAKLIKKGMVDWHDTKLRS